jgi:branched-chain amino acid aminotransferase
MSTTNDSNFEVHLNPAAASADTRAQIFKNPGFGVYFTDHMAHAQFRADDGIDEHSGVSTANGDWYDHEIIPYGNLSLNPAAAVLHYGQEIFEGIKAFKRADGSIWTFRIDKNAARFNESGKRLGLPDLPVSDFIESVKTLVNVDKEWAPSGEGEALYIRPFMIATEPFLGVRAAHLVDYYCILSPVGNYFGTPKPVSIWVEEEYFRAGPGGTGFAKCGGNYAASLLPAEKAYESGFSQVLYLDARDQESVEELGGMSFFAVYADGHVATPRLNGQILASVTRDTVLTLLREQGVDAREEKLSIHKLVDDIKSGRVVEAFACGTAAVVAPIGRLAGSEFDVTIGGGTEEGKLTQELRDKIVAIQRGDAPDEHGWCTRLV